MSDEMRKDENIEINEIKLHDSNLNDIFKESFIKRMNEEFDDIKTAIIGFNVDELKPSNLIILVQMIDTKNRKSDVIIEAKNEKHINKIYKVMNELK
ncbi:MAG: hypothetical protein FWH29_02765 [Methanobrevibacter sp.]|nr:hypothetical protein [Methanobrevibacter sp.]